MDYPLENLTPDSFQSLVQALLIKEFPGLQCYPVGQADGGRDATVLLPHSGTARDFCLFQIKFARHPEKIDDAYRWLEPILEKKLPKIDRQALKGAKRFLLVTNVRATSYATAGSMDKTQALLRKLLPIEGQCWWRDDLARRLDGAWDIKWSYPQILAGPDILRLILEAGISEQAERRMTSMRAVIAHQYEREREVRFKQVELQSRLLDLFVDTPVHLLSPDRAQAVCPDLPRIYVHLINKHGRTSAQRNIGRENWGYHDEGRAVGAGTFFLAPEVQAAVHRVVLEGAPGQGKSTVTQYLCQVHRLRLLQKAQELALLPAHHQSCPVRLPLRVDLRDFATWLSRRDPFSADVIAIRDSASHSLESFLAAAIHHYSGGTVFDVSDLLAVARVSSLLLVFDGLDEVADIKLRSEVVEQLQQGIVRMQEIAASLQVIITSRPAAFANSPGMSKHQYAFLSLGSLTQSLITGYAKRWASARSMEGRERNDLLRILDEKLHLPHLRDLARNPMQLTILLSLIHQRGTSLPDKRTALYDSYVDLFFSRESEKSPVVREHRELLINIHRYVAWTLHAESELGQASGRVPLARLQQMIKSYLRQEGHDEDLVQALFQGVVERVVALVSRIQGTYEFEVQPLREYFAARYLYDTAPYSPVGSERRGTKPDRFLGIARNFYWLNVTRFYAGCYSKGELPSLIDGLLELRDEPVFANLAHPRVLSATLLSDWVFSQHPRSVRQVVGLIFDPLGMQYLLATGRVDSFQSPLQLADQHARKALQAECWQSLDSASTPDFAHSVARLMRDNSDRSDTLAEWLKRLRKPSSRLRWLEIGLYLGHLSELDTATLAEYVDANRPAHIQLLFRAKRFDLLETVPQFRAKALEAILECSAPPASRASAGSCALGNFQQAVEPSRYRLALLLSEPVPLRVRWEQDDKDLDTDTSQGERKDGDAVQSKMNAVIATVQRESAKLASVWANSLQPWDAVVESGRSAFGDHWVFFRLAALAAGIRSTSERGGEYADPFDSKVSLCGRARYARMRAGQTSWWKRQLSVQGTPKGTHLFVLLLCASWASSRTLVELSDALSMALARLDPDSWQVLYDAYHDQIPVLSRDAGFAVTDGAIGNDISPRFAAVLMLRSVEDSAHSLYRKHIRSKGIKDVTVLGACQTIALSHLLGSSDWRADLEFVRECYGHGIRVERVSPYWFRREARQRQIALDLATMICGDPAKFPPQLVSVAEERLLEEAAKQVVPVGKVAKQERWFDT